MKTGISAARTKRECVCALAMDLIMASIASVLCSTWKVPPTMRMKPMIRPASAKPLIGAIISAVKPCGLLST
ncbi:hypothetical protein D3C85_1853820 [compost metagenome]